MRIRGVCVVSAGEQTESAGRIDGIQFGVMIGKLDTLISRFDRFETEMKSSTATKESVNALEKKVKELEETSATKESVKAVQEKVSDLEESPRRKATNWIAAISAIAAVAACVISLISLFH